MAKDPLLVITQPATLSFPHLATAQQPKSPKPGQKPKYSGAFVFDAGANLAELMTAAMAAGEKKWPGKFADMLKVGAVKWPFHKDGEFKGYGAGTVYFNARNEDRPGCVYSHATGGTGPDKDKPAVIPVEKIKEELYPGCKVRAQVRVFAYDNESKGVSFSLNNIQKIGEGARLDNRQAAEDAFEADLSAPLADLAKLGLA